jgi:hypothetical protein
MRKVTTELELLQSSAAAIGLVADDGRSVVGIDAGERGHVARPIAHGSRQLSDGLLPFGDRIEIAHAASPRLASVDCVFNPSRPGSLATLTAIRRASSLVSTPRQAIAALSWRAPWSNDRLQATMTPPHGQADYRRAGVCGWAPFRRELDAGVTEPPAARSHSGRCHRFAFTRRLSEIRLGRPRRIGIFSRVPLEVLSTSHFRPAVRILHIRHGCCPRRREDIFILDSELELQVFT